MTLTRYVSMVYDVAGKKYLTDSLFNSCFTLPKTLTEGANYLITVLTGNSLGRGCS